MLEYYSGVIILTTNRVGEFDEAFRSRIHISLYYPKLNEESTKQIWDRNLVHIRESGLNIDMEEEKIKRFRGRHWEENKGRPSRRWNGRQIKNAFQSALALANWDFHDGPHDSKLERPLLKAAHFKTVAKTSAHFDDYISDIHNLQDDDTYGILAQRAELRKDSILESPPKVSAQDGRAGRNGNSLRNAKQYNPGKLYSRGRDSDSLDDDDDDEVDSNDDDDDDDGPKDIQRLKLKLKLAKLKQQKGKGRKNKAESQSEKSDEADWLS